MSLLRPRQRDDQTAQPMTVKEAVEHIAQTRRIPAADVLSNAVSLEKAAQDTWERGGRVILEDKDGNKREVLPR